MHIPRNNFLPFVCAKLCAAVGILLISGGLALAQNTITLDMETAGQWDANFRTLTPVGGSATGQTTVSSNGMFRQDSTSGSTAGGYLFDQTPSDTTSATSSTFATNGTITVRFDARTSITNASFSVIFADPANIDNNVVAIVNLKTGTDQVRFFRDSQPATSGVPIGTQVNTTVGTETTPNTGAEPGSSFSTVSVTLTVSGTTPTLVVNWGGSTTTSVFAAGDFNFSANKVLIAFRLNDTATTTTPIDLDNIVITSPTAPDNVPGPPEVNVAPTLPAQANRSVAALDTLLVTNTGTDTNTPAQTLTYQLTSAPAGATISANGVIAWTPSVAQVSQTPYTFTTVVTDSGNPALTATNTFQVTVTAAPVFEYSQSLDFTNPSDFANNFRTITSIGGGTLGLVDGTFVLDARSGGGSTSGVLLYDTTPNDTSAATQTAFPTDKQVRVSFLARAATTGSAFTVSFADPRNINNRVTAKFILKTGDDTVSFFRDGSITATTSNDGTQVGTDVNFDAGAEPASGSFIPVTAILTVNGTTPTITVVAGSGAPVTSAFAPGDISWNPTLVLLRFSDPSTTAGPLELDNLLVAGGTPVVPPAPTYAPAPGADGNLLTVNPGFEATSTLTYTSAGAYHASYTLPGWNGFNDSYGKTHGISSGSVAATTTTEGTRKLVQREGGYILTDSTSRAQASPGLVYELRQDQRVPRRTYASEKLGSIRYIEFFDSLGVRIKQVWGTQNDYKVQYQGALNTWETFTLRAVAPPGTASVGVRLENPSGRFVSSSANYVDDRDVELDNIRLKVIYEPVDRLAYRRAPRLVEPGKTSALKINYAVTAARTLRVALVDAAGSERASSSVPAPAGRFRATPLSIAIPGGMPNGRYSWKIELLPTSGGPAVATLNVPGVLVDETVAAPTAANGTDFDADHPRIQFMGRIENTNPKQQWLHWFGSEVRVRFSGTSLALRGSITDNGFGSAESTNLTVVIDENFASPITVPINSFNYVKSLVSGLPDGVHTARLFKGNETDISLRVDGFRVDAGRGLLVPEPLPSRRIEVYGDSVTSGGETTPRYTAYAPLLGRELDADVHIISKGGTGVAGSFSNQDILARYYKNLSFPNVFNANSTDAKPWDFSRWTASIVVCAIGHNDQFQAPSSPPEATFGARYAEFIGYIRAAYPNAPFVGINTLISAPATQVQNAIEPLIPGDPLLSWAYQPNTWSDSVTGHPPTAGHAAMVYGDERRYSLADLVEDRAGWGLDTPLNGYEQWATSNFTPSEIVSGWHSPTMIVADDQMPNLLRYALGQPAFGQPSSPANLPAVGVNGAGRLTLDFFRASSDVNYIVEVSNDLVTWTPAATNPGSVGSLVQFVDGAALQAQERRFARLRVSQ